MSLNINSIPTKSGDYVRLVMENDKTDQSIIHTTFFQPINSKYQYKNMLTHVGMTQWFQSLAFYFSVEGIKYVHLQRRQRCRNHYITKANSATKRSSFPPLKFVTNPTGPNFAGLYISNV